MEETLRSAREALDRHAWTEALEDFRRADREGELSPGDLELLAEAAWWDGHPDEAVEALERAYAGHLEAHDRTRAAMVAVRLADQALARMAFAVLQGWVARAERLLEGEPESAVHAWLSLMHGVEALFIRDDAEAALEHTDRAIELGAKHRDSSIHSLAMSVKGQLLIRTERWAEGLALIDEASAAAAAGELRPKTACDVHCVTIAACRDLADYRRAGEWADEAERWMERRAIRGYPGVCRVYRAELKRLRGSWPEAEQEARRACQELERFRLLYLVGSAHYEVGEVRLRMGDLEGAEEAFHRAYENGWDPQPGMALLALARGDADEAARSIAHSLGEGPGADAPMARAQDPLNRPRLLPAQVEIALARGDLDTAREAARELEEISERYQRPAWQAAALTARGAISLHDGEAQGAVGLLERAWRLWLEADLPYESAKARELLGRALEATGEPGRARLELRAARSSFQRLGADLDLRRVEDLLGEDGAPEAIRARVTKTFMFTDIVTSTDLVGVIGDAAWEELLRWHDRELRAAFGHHGGEEVSHTGDGFFVAFDRAAQAVECAVAIQRRLAEHRRQHGFAPQVRIGLHAAEATRERGDYRGRGVHTAARVGELAEGEEIVITEAALQEAGTLRFPISELRAVSLKGIPEPVKVTTVDWR